jgi:hypothetical protein
MDRHHRESIARNIGHHVYVLMWALLLTAVTRTITLRTVVSWWFVGFFPVIAVNFLLQRPMGLLVGRESTFLGQASDHVVEVRVSNDGPAIPPRHRERVFERFTRLDNARSRDAGGTGLGLAIVREIARTHGGDVEVGDPPQGACFVARLPGRGH